MSTLVPQRTALPLRPFDTERGSTTTARPFGLSLSRPVDNGAPLDLTGAFYDPATQTLVGADGTIWAGRSSQTIKTREKTRYDHSHFQDDDEETRTD
ncbi:putative ATP-grasp-modified RiPP [Micromonospora fluostatini]